MILTLNITKHRKELTLKIGMNVEKFLANWALQHSEELIETFEDSLANQNITDTEKITLIYSKTLNFIFAAVSETISENNKAIERQLRRAGIQLP